MSCFRSGVRKVFALAVLVVSTLSSAQGALLKGTITKLSDGDTVHFQPDRGGKKLKVRFLSIDTPELNGRETQGQWAVDATEHLASLMPVGSEVELETIGEDKFGRTLGRFFKNGQDINLQMVRDGQAALYVICNTEVCNPGYFEKYDIPAYQAACEQAIREGRGIFDPRNPLREMPFEFRLRVGHRKPDKFVGDYRTKVLYEPAEYSRVDFCKRIFFFNEEDAAAARFRRTR